MGNNEISIQKGEAGLYHIVIKAKPATDVITSSLQILAQADVRAIQVLMSAALATEFRVVQLLSFLRREGKAISITWSDHAPSASVHQIIQSIIQ